MWPLLSLRCVESGICGADTVIEGIPETTFSVCVSEREAKVQQVVSKIYVELLYMEIKEQEPKHFCVN